MLTRTLLLGSLPVGARFRFPEEAPSQGFPYVVLPTPATYRGDQHFQPDDRPVVIHRKDGRYPRYGTVAGYYPVQNDQGNVVAWVANPKTRVVVARRWGRTLALGMLSMLFLAIALGGAYWLLTRLAQA